MRHLAKVGGVKSQCPGVNNKDGNIKSNFESVNYYNEKRYLFFLIYWRVTSPVFAGLGRYRHSKHLRKLETEV